MVHLGILSSNETWLENVNAHGNTPVYGGRPHGINMHKLLLDGGIISTICIYIYTHLDMHLAKTFVSYRISDYTVACECPKKTTLELS